MPTSARHPCTNSIKEDITLSQYEKEINRRRTFAIISHPDAGKTTLTEKFLLYGGAIAQAGQVKGKKNTRAATSDWMEIEKQRGISVTSSVMQFQYEGYCINILDTPGHQDFSEDTYRTLMAADSAVMVIDAAKGVEAQTRKLFKVCAMRDIPIFTFINKMDREARDSFELLEELEKELGIETYPVNWPIGCGKEFKGVYDRGSRKIIHFTSNGGAKAATATEVELGDPNLDGLIGERLHRQLTDEIELLDGAAAEFDLDRVPRQALPGVLRFRPHQLRRGALPGALPPDDHRPPAPAGGRAGGGLPGRRLLRVCVQDPGQHEQGPPGPHRLYAHRLRPL